MGYCSRTLCMRFAMSFAHRWVGGPSACHTMAWLARTAASMLAAMAVEATEPATNRGEFERCIQRMFADDQTADVRVVFGYDNSFDLKDPSDPARARNFMAYLTAQSFAEIPCTEALANELGVPAAAQNLRLFQGDGGPGRTLRVSLMWSSATLSTGRNLGSEYPRQLRCSSEALKFMQKASSDAEVMAYVGHSRGGGGPDTYPPETLNYAGGERQQVDFSHYRRTRPGLAALESSFRNSRRAPSFIAWTGCFAEPHFRRWLSDVLCRRDEPTCLVLSTRIIRHMPWKKVIEGNDEGLMVVVSLLEAIRNNGSQAAFEQRLQACELEELRETYMPAWKLIMLPANAITPGE